MYASFRRKKTLLSTITIGLVKNATHHLTVLAPNV